MPQSRPPHTIDALYAVGRNVVSFQHLEQILKHLAVFAPVCATSSTLQSELEKRKSKVERLTLGRAVRTWIESEFHITEPKQVPRLDEQIIISFRFALPERGPEYFDRLSSELESLAQERNSLIHLDLAQLNFEDEAQCTALSIRLDAQNERIIGITKFLEPILVQMQECVRLITSDEGLIQELVSPTFVEEEAE